MIHRHQLEFTKECKEGPTVEIYYCHSQTKRKIVTLVNAQKHLLKFNICLKKEKNNFEKRDVLKPLANGELWIIPLNGLGTVYDEHTS